MEDQDNPQILEGENMSNDPRDAIVDLSKLIRNQPSPSTPIIQARTVPNSITNCNEGTNMVGHENFSRGEKPNQIKKTWV